MSEATLSGAEFKKQLRAGQPKLGLFLNAHSPTVAEQLAWFDGLPRMPGIEGGFLSFSKKERGLFAQKPTRLPVRASYYAGQP